MSLTFESPTPSGESSNDAYFTPFNESNIISPTDNSSNENNNPNSPYYTAPINTMFHQEFLNAIQARHNSQNTALSSPSKGKRPNLTLDSLASRRQKLEQQLQLQRQQQQQQIQQKSTVTTSESASFIKLLDPIDLKDLLTKFKQDSKSLLILDVRSFVQFSHSRICSSINVSIPNTILKRPTFTLDRVFETIVNEGARERLRGFQTIDCIVFYDQQSQLVQENSACAYLSTKLIKSGFKGKLYSLKGGFDSFSEQYKNFIESISSPTSLSMDRNLPTGPPTISTSLNNGGSSRRHMLRLNNLPMNTPTLGPFTAPMPQFDNQAFNPFFSNIRQNMELSHGPIRERFPIRLPPQCNTKHESYFVAPVWLQNTVKEDGPKLLADNYEKLERIEQRRLQNIMHFHSKHTSNSSEFPFSIVAGIEMGALNRYTNIWPYEYTRVKIEEYQTSDYINASYVQYMNGEEIASDARPETINMKLVNKVKEGPHSSPYRRYISTQGPLPATFNDFWQMVWEQESRVLVMLTKEEEMNKIKCHRYWPSILNEPVQYGKILVTLTSETLYNVKGLDKTDEEDMIIMRQLIISKNGENQSVTHLQYIGWMDFGVPDNPLGTLQLIQMANTMQEMHSKLPSGPMIVHCSAGCGRSGAFCAIDTTLYRLSQTDCSTTSDILLETISCFREQRLSMVQTLRQFVFCYEAIWWWLLGYDPNGFSLS
ncbi:hypothetical protein G6F56_008159 [Rhizopus delemar]|nr:hypothetical protein G6F56_008159 [Rhizopus delemar]